MGRPKKSDTEPAQDLDAAQGLAADLLEQMNKSATSSKAYLQGDEGERTWGVPIPHLAFQYLIGGSTVLPLQRYLGFSGFPKSYKSTLQVEIGNWFCAQNGIHLLFDTENKTSPTMIDALTWWRKDLPANPLRVRKSCMSIEEWQTLVTKAVETARGRVAAPGKRVPIFIVIDSLGGRADEGADEKLRKEGHAEQRGFPVGAMQITRFLSSLNLLGTTSMIAWVQHLTEKIAQSGYGPPQVEEKGAKAAAYAGSAQIRITKGSSFQYASHDSAPYPEIPVEGYTLWINTARGCIGPDDRTVPVDLMWQYVPQEGGTRRQAMWFDWDGALGRMLCLMKYSDKWYPKLFAYDKEQLANVIDFAEVKKNVVNSKTLGLEGVSYTAFGKAIKENHDVYKALSQHLGITAYPDVQSADVDWEAGSLSDS